MERRLGHSKIEARQLPYDPFDDPIRAARQEFGDVLAEGLYGLLHRGGYGYPTSDYWDRFLDARRCFLDAIIDRLHIAKPERQAKIHKAVETAQRCLMAIRPHHYEEYISLWTADLGRWNRLLNEIPRLPTIEAALDHLDLAPTESAARTPRIVDMYVAAPLAEVAPRVPVVGHRLGKNLETASSGPNGGLGSSRAPARPTGPGSGVSPTAAGPVIGPSESG